MTSALRRRLLTGLFALIWIVEAALTHTPADRLPEVPGSDKTKHFLAYAALGLLGALALRAWRVSLRHRLWILPVALLAWAVVDEVTQPLVNRYCSGWDILADAAGVAIALLVDLAVECIQRRRGRERA